MSNTITDIELLSDTLGDHKSVNECYNMFANECQNEKLRNCALMLLTKEHELQAEIFVCLNKLGGYPIKEANNECIKEIIDKLNEN